MIVPTRACVVVCVAGLACSSLAIEPGRDGRGVERLDGAASAGGVGMAATRLPAIETPGRVDAVTVYREQALVTRVVTVDGEAGLREVVVTDLPEHVVPSSLFAESGEGLSVRSVRYRERPVEQDVRREVRELDERLEQIEVRLFENAKKAELLAQHRGHLDKLEAFVAPTASAELTRGVLNAETLERLSAFLKTERGVLVAGEIQQINDRRALEEEKSLLERQRQQLTGRSSRTVREALVFVDVQRKSGGELRLRYLVEQATWTPSYTIRGGEARDGLRVEYYASIQQMSGEDWPDVRMTLSTATPSLVAKAPELTAMHLELAPAAQAGVLYQQIQSGGYEGLKDKLARQQKQVAEFRARNRADAIGHAEEFFDAGQREGGPVTAGRSTAQAAGAGGGGPFVQSIDPAAIDAHLNDLACSMQMIDLLNDERIARRGVEARPAGASGVCVTYDLDAEASLPSRADRQLVQIAAVSLDAQFYKLAAPLLTDAVYDEASATNTSGVVLLAGPVTTYMGGRFVGGGQMKTVAVGERFVVGLGVDPSLRVARELVEKKDEVQGGNRVAELTYRLSLENFGSEAAQVRLLDRLPAVQGNDIRVTLVKTGADLSGDAEYLASERKGGLLRWDATVPARAAGTGALGVEYTFRLEFDKQMSLSGLALGR